MPRGVPGAELRSIGFPRTSEALPNCSGKLVPPCSTQPCCGPPNKDNDATVRRRPTQIPRTRNCPGHPGRHHHRAARRPHGRPVIDSTSSGRSAPRCATMPRSVRGVRMRPAMRPEHRRILFFRRTGVATTDRYSNSPSHWTAGRWQPAGIMPAFPDPSSFLCPAAFSNAPTATARRPTSPAGSRRLSFVKNAAFPPRRSP